MISAGYFKKDSSQANPRMIEASIKIDGVHSELRYVDYIGTRFEPTKGLYTLTIINRNQGMELLTLVNNIQDPGIGLGYSANTNRFLSNREQSLFTLPKTDSPFVCSAEYNEDVDKLTQIVINVMGLKPRER